MPSRRPIRSTARSSASPLPKTSHGSSSSPRSTHSIANAMVPPVLMVSMPSSSQRCDARRTASPSPTPQRDPSANRLSYSTRTPVFPTE
jgi:hypothetical protein